MPATARMVSAPEKDVVFLSRRAELKLVVKRKQELKDSEGNVRETVQGEHVKFENGVLRVPPHGHMRGEHGEVLEAAEILKYLLGDGEAGRLAHPLLGDRFDGFWRHDEPAPSPTTQEREILAELAMELDVEGLRRYISQEESGWARDELLGEARASLERAEEKAAEREAELAAARAEGAASQAGKPAGKASA
jgi:hypothetical protein